MKGLSVVLATFVLAGCTTIRYGRPLATAELSNPSGAAVGKAAFWVEPPGVRVLVRVRGLSPGSHGIHIYYIRKCDPADLESAGSQFNSAGKQEDRNPASRRMGELPNLEIAADGKGQLNSVVPPLGLYTGSTALFGPEGSALVIDATPGEEATERSGNSGAGIACGVLQTVPPSFSKGGGLGGWPGGFGVGPVFR